MPREVAGSVIVITGASSGIGRATALRFARSGATVVVTSRREDVLRELATCCERLGGKAMAMTADVTDQEAMQSLARRVAETFERIDVWINNAAVTLFSRFEQSPPEAFRRVIETNFFGYVHGARAVLPYFREQGSGILINISSSVGKIGSPFSSAYAASKFAIIGLSDSLRMELQDAPNIRVCTVLPAAVDTPLYQHAANFTGRGAKPIPPVYKPEAVASALVELVRDPRREIVIGNAVKLGLIVHAVAPQLTEKVFARGVEREQFEDRPAQRSEGNLFKAMERSDGASGGWREVIGNRRSSRAALLGAALLGSGLGLCLARLTWRKDRSF